MALLDRIQTEMTAAMKAKDEARCWKLWLRTRAQRVAAFAVLLMSVLGVFGGGHQSHLHREPPIIPTTTNRLTIASGNTTPVTASFIHNLVVGQFGGQNGCSGIW